MAAEATAAAPAADTDCNTQKGTMDMAWFGQGRDTLEWRESRDDVLFYKWPAVEIKQGSTLVIRPGQKAVFYANGVVEGIFEEPGNYDIASEIVPFLSTLAGIIQLRGDTGLRAEVYFVNSKELLLKWGTRQRIMIPTVEVPAGIPVGCNGNLVVLFREYRTFIEKVAGVKETYTLGDVAERIVGELNPIVAEAILGGHERIGTGVLAQLQQNSRELGKTICGELDRELASIGLGVVDVNILSINYPASVQKMAEKAAAQSFVSDVGKYAAISMADSLEKNGGNSAATIGMQFAMGQQIAKQVAGSLGAQEAPAIACESCGKPVKADANFCPECGAARKPAQQATGDKFCPVCRKMTTGKFCSDCGAQTV